MTDMIALPGTRMTVDEYLAWAQGQPGRYELLDGVVFAMSPEGAGHAEKESSRSRSLALRHSRARGSLLRPPGRHDRSYR
jgi:Uma2 family endonuclease